MFWSWLFKQGMGRRVPEAKPRPPAPREVYGLLTDLPAGVIVGAGFAPGFSYDLSSWRVWVDQAGHVRQDIRLSVPENRWRPKELTELSEAGPEAVAGLQKLADEIGLREMAAQYDSMCTDQELVSVAVRYSDRVCSVAVYGAWWLADQGHPQSMGVIRFWQAVQRLAPWQPSWAVVPR
jgi:hypothetical protein